MMETQPPPNAAPPPPAEEALRSRRYLVIMVVVSVIGALLGWLLFETVVMRSTKHPPYVRTMSDARILGLALMEFDKDYGRYPDADTIARVKEITATDLSLGTATSNDFFRQLLAAGYGNEKMCHVRIEGSKRPDEVMTGSKALEKGECGFAYIPGLSSSQSTNTPIVIASLMRGTDKIDPKLFGGKAVIFRLDGGVGEGEMDKDGHLIIFGKRLLDPTNPIWGGKPPTLVWPE